MGEKGKTWLIKCERPLRKHLFMLNLKKKKKKKKKKKGRNYKKWQSKKKSRQMQCESWNP